MDVRQLCLDYLDRQRKFKNEEENFERYKKEFKKNVRSYLGRKGRTSFTFGSDDGRKLSVSDVRPTKISFDVAKLKKKLPKELYEKIVTKRCIVNDWDGFVKYMKLCGAEARMVLSFMEADVQFDKQAADALFESGEFTLDMVEGCYETVVSEGYIKVTEMES